MYASLPSQVMSAFPLRIRQSSLRASSIGLLLSFCARSRGHRRARRALVCPNEQIDSTSTNKLGVPLRIPLSTSAHSPCFPPGIDCTQTASTYVVVLALPYLPSLPSDILARSHSSPITFVALRISPPLPTVALVHAVSCLPSMCCVPYR